MTLKESEDIRVMIDEYPNWNNVGCCSHIDLNNKCVKCGRYFIIERGIKRFYLANGFNYTNRILNKKVSQ
jgi:hypothetical protein